MCYRGPAAFIFAAAHKFWPNPAITSIKWGLVAVYFGATVGGLFSYLATADSITRSHLYTAVSIYLLLGFLWYALYSAVACPSPGAFLSSEHALVSRSELLYFSLVTLTTVGYSDIVPLRGEVRMFAALEAVTGVLYVAIRVGILVSSYRRHGST
jgi:voltage-gated potassium channel Kch